MRLVSKLLASLVVLLALAVPALAREEIRAFASDVELRVDGSVLVTETIDVNAEGYNIQRGIYRDIPVTMLNDSGNKIRIDLHVEAVTRKGKAEPFRVERMGDFLRIWIGDPNVLLTYGEHRYTIRYTMNRMVRPTANGAGDELYWNATGNYWDFPILSSVARVRLPEGAEIGDLAAYSGPAGSDRQDVTITRESDTSATFRTRRSLGPGEGMTFAVSFQKGIVVYPEGTEALVQNLSDLRDVWLPIAGVILLLAYNLIAWMRVGRDPPRGTIIPLFHPPRDFSPALTHYVHRWGFANGGWTAMTAAIFNLGVKGLVTIRNSGKTLSVSTTGKKPEGKLPVGEQVLFSYFEGRGTVTFDKANGKDLGAKRTEFTTAIESENRKVWFNHNTGYAVGSFLLAMVAVGIMVVFDVIEPEWLIAGVFGGAALGVLATVVYGMVHSGGWLQRILAGFVVSVFLLNMGGGLLETFSSISVNTALIATASMVILSIGFAVLMRAPTIQGRKVMDEIEGFKLYLETAEKNRLNMTAEPPLTVERFERILPYAIALGVEKPWSEHFEAELARSAVVDSRTSYSPAWYSGSRDFNSGSLSRAISTASSSMAAAMVAAQPVQASSSGSGGGGFSGGGGGGGGGGGW